LTNNADRDKRVALTSHPVRLSAAAVALLLLVGAPPEAQSVKPNVILIQADDLGYGDLSVYGQTKIGRASCRERV